MIVLVLIVTTFTFAGVYPSSLVVPGLLCAGLVIVYRPWVYRPWVYKPRAVRAGPTAALDLTLAASIALIAFQLVPLPGRVVDVVSPADRRVWRALSLESPTGALPLSIDPQSTVWALGVTAGALLLFLTTRRVLETGGVRIVTRGIAAAGLVLGALGLAQDATGHGRMYWHWKPLEEGAPPFGPFVDRNHFATWAVLAIPLCLGYLAAHATAHRPREVQPAPWHRRVRLLFDARAIWLAACVCLMLVALVTSLSRSGMVGLAAALALGVALQMRRGESSPRGLGWIAGGLGLGLVLTLIRVDPSSIVQRFAAVPAAATSRLEIWHETTPLVRDFWLTGTGAGTYETAMLVYQQTSSGFRINAAHNHYLQVAAEGGLLVGLPALAALILFIRAAADALASDDSGMYWLRAGAASGLVGVGVQSIWETGLTTPANAALAAVLAAIVIHTAGPRGRPKR